MISKELAKAGAVAMALAASEYIPESTVELANNVASVVADEENRKSVHRVAMEAIRHRVKHGWIKCRRGYSRICAYAMDKAWTETVKGESR